MALFTFTGGLQTEVMWKTLHLNVRIRLINTFLTRLVSSAIYPFMAIYFSTHLGAGLAGLLLAGLVGTEFVAGLYGGGLADTWGRRRTLLTGELLALAGYSFLLLSNLSVQLPWPTFAALALISVASGLINPAAEAMLIDVSTPESRTFMYAANYWIINISILIGTLLGGWFYQDHLAGLLAGLLSMSCITLFLAWRFMSETLQPRLGGTTGKGTGLGALVTSYREVLRDRPFVLFLLAFVLMISIEFGRANFIPIHLDQHFAERTVLGIDLTGIKVRSLLSAENTLLCIALTIPVTAWVKRHDLGRMMLWGTVLYAGGFVALYGSVHLGVLLLSSLVLTVGELLYVPTRQTLLADMIPADRRGVYLAASGQVLTLARLLAALGIPLGALIGVYGMMVVVGVFGVCSALLGQLSLRLQDRRAR